MSERSPNIEAPVHSNVRWRKALADLSPLALAAPAIAVLIASLVVWPPTGWSHPTFAIVMTVVIVASARVLVPIKGGWISADFTLLIILAALEQPSAAVLAAFLSVVSVHGIRIDRSDRVATSLTAAVVPVALAALISQVALTAGAGDSAAEYGLVVVASFCIAITLNFFIAFAPDLDRDGEPMRRLFAAILVPLAPQQFMLACAAGMVPAIKAEVGIGGMMLGALAALGFQWVVAELLASRQRGEEAITRMNELQEFSISTLKTLLHSISLRDKMTARHSAAVSRYAQKIALELGADPAWVRDTLRPAATLHDIGKHVFPDDILKGTTKLTDEQFELVKSHPVAGWDLVRRLPGYEEIARIIRHHHERIDGGGYPDGLIADEIPFASRCISVADVFDVMTARDTYQDAKPVAEAVAELKRVAGSQLDAQCVDAFLRVLERESLTSVMFDHTSDEDLQRTLESDLDAAAPLAV